MHLMFRRTFAAALAVAATLPAMAAEPAAAPAADAPAPVMMDVPAPRPLPPGKDYPAGTPLDLMIGELALPFAYRVVSSDLSISTTLGLSAGQEIRFIPTEGPRTGQELTLRLRYVAPEKVEAGFVQSAIRAEAEKFAADPRTLVIKPLRIDDFDFTVADTWIKDGDKMVRTLRLMGNVNGSLVNLFLPDPGDVSQPSDLVPVLSGLRFDFTRTLKLRARLDAEAKRVIGTDQFRTVVGTLQEPKGMDARLLSATASYDGEGKLVGASHTFGFYKVGFWQVQNFAVNVSCSIGLPADEAELARLRNPFRTLDEGTVRVSRTREAIGGVTADRDVIRIPGSYGIMTDVSRWYAEDGERSYMVRIDRMNSRAQQAKLEAQMKAMRFECAPANGIGELPAAAATGAPAAAPAAGTAAN